MSNLSFARIMYGTSQEAHSPMFGAASNFPSSIQQSTDAASRVSVHEPHGATVESILHKVWMALSEKK
jgi:hypothetical protein